MTRSWTAWLGIELSVVSAKEKLISGLAGFVSLLVLVLVCEHYLAAGAAGLIASMGASAVLLFAVPHSPFSQPWPVLAGHGFSAALGVACARWIPHHGLAAAAAVGLAILAMHQFKCIHPPGGATALTAVVGGPAVVSLGFHFILTPVLVNALLMVTLATSLNAFFPWRRYPAAWNRLPHPPGAQTAKPAPSHEEVVSALRSLDSFVDITEEDLLRLTQMLQSPVGKATAEAAGARR